MEAAFEAFQRGRFSLAKIFAASVLKAYQTHPLRIYITETESRLTKADLSGPCDPPRLKYICFLSEFHFQYGEFEETIRLCSYLIKSPLDEKKKEEVRTLWLRAYECQKLLKEIEALLLFGDLHQVLPAYAKFKKICYHGASPS